MFSDWNLVIIDGQNCFAKPGGELFVPGADLDMGVRLPAFIRKNQQKISKIIYSLDWHVQDHVSFITFWQNPKGEHPDPFTTITIDDLLNGNWKPVNNNYYSKVKWFLESYDITVFPPHGIANTEGAELVKELLLAINEWEQQQNKKAIVIKKALNPCIEQFSAFKALSEDPDDPSTKLNKNAIDIIKDAEQIFWAGEASSHCVKHSVEDFAANCGGQQYIERSILLIDAMSPVTGFEQQAEKFIEDMQKIGMQINKTTDFF